MLEPGGGDRGEEFRESSADTFEVVEKEEIAPFQSVIYFLGVDHAAKLLHKHELVIASNETIKQ